MKGIDHVEEQRSMDRMNVGVPTLIQSDHTKTMLRLTACWLRVAKRLTNPGLSEDVPETLPPTERTRYLWATIEPEPGSVWAEVAGLPYAPHVHRAMMALLDNAVIFPDGTISDWAKRLLLADAYRGGIKAIEGDGVEGAT